MGQRNICIIEDNENNLYLIKYLLELNGYQVIYAMNGLDGIELVAHEKPDLVLLDIQLPKMNGYEVARRLRMIAGQENLPIIAVTSYAMPGDREKALEAGCTGYIEKPINPETFIGNVRQYMPGDPEGIEHE